MTGTRGFFLRLSTFLMLLSPATAQKLPDAPSAFLTKPVVILAIVDAGVHAADGLLTQRNLACAEGVEHDPLARPFVTHGQPMSSLYFGVTYAGDLGIAYLLHRKRHDRLARLFLLGAVSNSTYGWTTSLHGWHGCGIGGHRG